MTDTVTEALCDATRGWRVIPLHTIRNGGCTCGKTGCKPGKHPLGKLVPNGLTNATCDPNIIMNWWQREPDANLAIVTGADSGLVVVDVDPRDGGDDTLADLEVLYGKLPHTVETVTGSGGRHIYFNHPGIEIRNSAGTKLGAGLDIRGDGGYVAAPPSVHISGGIYSWELSSHPNDTELADMPQWLSDLAIGPKSNTNGYATNGQGPKTGLPIAKHAYEFVAEGAPVGQQRERAVKTARSYIGNGKSTQETIDALWKGFQASSVGEPSSPWTYQNAAKIVNDLISHPAPPPAPLQKPQHQQATNGATLPTIYASCQDLKEITDDCWAAIQQANDPPRYFRHGGIPSRIEDDDQGAPVVREMTTDRLRHELARIAEWKARKLQKDGTWAEVEARPPLDVMKDILATPNPPLPVLTRIVEVPVFAADGTLQTAPGYHAAARTYYAPTEGLTIPDVAELPTQRDVDRARALILEMVCDFPFVSEADRANAIALLLLPFVRDMVNGPTPNHLIEAPTPGSGKGLLSEMLLAPAVGGNFGMVTQPKSDDELRKQLTSQFKDGRSVILMDNVNDLSSGVLASALTATTWDDRLLGETAMLSLSVRCVWATTANNPTMSTEIARRCVRIRLDPKVDRPWQRGDENFTHPNLREWVSVHRGELAWAALTLAQSWIKAGKPAATVKPLGSYEQWTATIGGILSHAAIPAFLANLNEFYEVADIEGQVWRQFVVAWWEHHAENEVGTAQLFPLAQETELFDLGKGGERSQKITFGKQLARQRDRVIGEYRIVQAAKSHNTSKWRLLPTKNILPKQENISGDRGMLGMLGDVSYSNLRTETIIENPSEGKTSPYIPHIPLFDLTESWQEVPKGTAVQGGDGLEVRFDQSTDTTYARRHQQEEEPECNYDDYEEVL